MKFHKPFGLGMMPKANPDALELEEALSSVSGGLA